MMMITNVDELVRVRQKMKAKVAELDREIGAIEVETKLIESELLEMCKELGVDSFKTEHGTVSRVIRERYWTNDWSVLHEYILEHGALELLEKRVQQTNMRSWIETHPTDHPPGLNIDREYVISIRKPTKKRSTTDESVPD